MNYKPTCFHCVHAHVTVENDPDVGIFDEYGFECPHCEYDGPQGAIAQSIAAILDDMEDSDEIPSMREWGDYAEGFAEHCPGFRPIVVETTCDCCGSEFNHIEHGPGSTSWHYWPHPEADKPVPLCSEHCQRIMRKVESLIAAHEREIERAHVTDTQYPKVTCSCCGKEYYPRWSRKYWVIDFVSEQVRHVCSDECSTKLSLLRSPVVDELCESDAVAQSVRKFSNSRSLES